MRAHLQINGKSFCMCHDAATDTATFKVQEEALDFVLCEYVEETDARRAAELLGKHGVDAQVVLGPCLEYLKDY